MKIFKNTKRKFSRIYFLFFLLLFSSSAFSKVSNENCPLAVKLELEKTENSIIAKVYLSNISNKPIPVFNFLFPTKGCELENSLFEVMKNGTKQHYKGRLTKRSGSSVFELRPMEKKETEIDLGKYYDVSSPGVYKIKYKIYYESQIHSLCKLESNQLKIEIK